MCRNHQYVLPRTQLRTLTIHYYRRRRRRRHWRRRLGAGRGRSVAQQRQQAILEAAKRHPSAVRVRIAQARRHQHRFAILQVERVAQLPQGARVQAAAGGPIVTAEHLVELLLVRIAGDVGHSISEEISDEINRNPNMKHHSVVDSIIVG